MKTYRKAVILYVIIFICSMLILFTASAGNVNYPNLKYFIVTIGPVIIIISASFLRKIIDDLIPKEKR